jgi:transposase
MYRKISRDLKIASLNLYEHGQLSLPEILDCVGFSESTFYRCLKLWRTTGDPVRVSYAPKGRPRKLDFTDVHYLVRLVNARPDWFLDELLDLLETNRFISIHFTTIFRTLERANVSRKKLKAIAAERNETLRATYVYRMGQYTPDQLCFLDETSKDERTQKRSYGRSQRGKRAVMKQVFVRGRRVTAVGCLTLDGIIAGHVVEGSLVRNTYLEFLEHSVVFVLLTTLIALSHLLLSSCHFVTHIRVNVACSLWIMHVFIMVLKSLNLLNVFVRKS